MKRNLFLEHCTDSVEYCDAHLQFSDCYIQYISSNSTVIPKHFDFHRLTCDQFSCILLSLVRFVFH